MAKPTITSVAADLATYKTQTDARLTKLEKGTPPVVTPPPVANVIVKLDLSSAGLTKAEGSADAAGDWPFVVKKVGDAKYKITVDYAVQPSGNNPVQAADFPGGVFPSGTCLIDAGETQETIHIPIVQDYNNEPDENFILVLSNPKAPAGVTVQFAQDPPRASATITNDDATVPPTSPPTTTPPANPGTKAVQWMPAGIKLTPSYEQLFNLPDGNLPDGLFDRNYWYGSDGRSKHNGYPDGVWPDQPSSRMINGEYAIYVNKSYNGMETATIKNKTLLLTCTANPNKNDPLTKNPYTGAAVDFISSLVTTQSSFKQQYGYFVSRQKLPQGKGAFPAFWLLGEPYTANQAAEVDIYENVAVILKRLWCSSHPGQSDMFDILTPGFHEFGVLIDPNWVTWLYDGVAVKKIKNVDFQIPMYMLIDHAAGGWDGNSPPPASSYPQTLEVDWVRAFPLA